MACPVLFQLHGRFQKKGEKKESLTTYAVPCLGSLGISQTGVTLISSVSCLAACSDEGARPHPFPSGLEATQEDAQAPAKLNSWSTAGRLIHSGNCDTARSTKALSTLA